MEKNILDLREDKKEEPEVNPEHLYDKPAFFGRFKDYFVEIIKIVVISLIIIIPIRMYVIQPFIVEGDSMLPNFHNGEYLIVDEISYRFNEPARGDVVIFHPPQDKSTYYIKRLIGLPGDTVELKGGDIYINGSKLEEGAYLSQSTVNEIEKIELGEDEYYVVGDNRDNSLDSRRFGPINSSNIKGRAFVRAYPLNNITVFKTFEYNL